MNRQPKIQMNITEDFENQILEYSQKLGMSKNEFVRYSIQSVIVGFKQSQEAINQVAKEFIQKEANNI